MASTTPDPSADSPPPDEHVDVLVVGAGISGIGAAYHLTHQRPGTTFVVLESQEDFGGTWLTHKYPGIRSDSDLYTFGYRFKPWTGKPIATAAEIRSYLGEVIDENDLAAHIRYRHSIATAVWSTDERRWTVSGSRGGEPFTITAAFLWMCQGYYRHSEGYTPEWPGTDRFDGTIIHPQTWPTDLDYRDKRVVVIGSGATAATIIPAMVADVGHITMLQRSPTYFRIGRNAIEIADQLRQVDIPEEWIHEIVRRRILFEQDWFTKRCFSEPDVVKKEMIADVGAHLDPDYDVDTHFTPSYMPWRQRVAFVPDADLFEGINSGKASVVTGEIETFTETGIQVTDGDYLDADIVITATGFNLNVLGDIAFTIDDEPLDFHATVTYHGTMFTGVPNMAWVFGYFRASWTLRADLIADYVCRLLAHMDERGAQMVVPRLRPEDEGMKLLPWVDPGNFNPGYIQRGLHLLPRQGDREPWRHTQDYWSEKDILPAADLDDGALAYA
jgi:cation diffusion facilitator CzcD-associated flavoprotein CzcO